MVFAKKVAAPQEQRLVLKAALKRTAEIDLLSGGAAFAVTLVVTDLTAAGVQSLLDGVNGEGFVELVVVSGGKDQDDNKH